MAPVGRITGEDLRTVAWTPRRLLAITITMTLNITVPPKTLAATAVGAVADSESPGTSVVSGVLRPLQTTQYPGGTARLYSYVFQ